MQNLTVCRPKVKQYRMDRAADDVNIINCHIMNAEKMHTVRLELPANEAGDVLTVGHLAKGVCVETGVDLWNQILTFKGRKLLDPHYPLSLLGITDGSIVQLHLKDLSPIYDTPENRIKFIEKEIDKLMNRLSGIIYKCDGIHRGYFPTEYNIDCFKAYRVALRECSLDLKGELNRLNVLDLINCDKVLKQKRRYLVRRIQTYQHRIACMDDGLRDVITRLSA